MSMWTLAAAVALTGASVGLHQGQTPEQARAPQAPTVEVSAQKRVSVNFSQAAAKDVLDWLTKNGSSFVVADQDLPKDLSLTLSIQDEPIEDVMDAVADALGGHWESRGGVRVFHKGQGFMRGFGPEAVRAWAGPDMKEFKAAMPNMKEFRIPRGEMPKMKEFRVPLSKEFMPDFKEFAVPNMEELKDMPKVRIEIRKEMEQARKEMERARTEMEKARKEHPEAFADGAHDFLFVNPDAKGSYRIERKHALPSRTIRVGGNQDISKLFGSLSNEQRELNRRQGYLKLSDLRPEQLKMLGLDANAKDVTITIVRNGDKLTIKS